TQAPAALAVNDPLRPSQWGLDMIGADAAHAITTGVGATVAVIDTGAQLDHPDLAGRLIPGYDYIDHDNTPQDGEAHGPHVAAAAGNNSLPVCEQPSGQGRLLCVGAVDRRGSRSYFSDFGNGLGLVAPGGSGLPVGPDEDVLSTYPPSGYAMLAGTSQAAPH